MFEDKEILVVWPRNGECEGYTYKGEIVSLEEGVGFTVINKDDLDEYLVCHDYRLNDVSTKKMFNLVKEALDYSSTLNVEKIYQYAASLELAGSNPTQEDCVFNR